MRNGTEVSVVSVRVVKKSECVRRSGCAGKRRAAVRSAGRGGKKERISEAGVDAV